MVYLGGEGGKPTEGKFQKKPLCVLFMLLLQEQLGFLRERLEGKGGGGGREDISLADVQIARIKGRRAS